MTLITEFQYFGCINYYKTLFRVTNIEFDVYHPYKKMSFRNRTLLSGGNGIIELSVPLVHGRNQRIPMREVKIDNQQKWQVQHWRSIVSAYNRSPWFEYYKHTLEILFELRFEYLWEWDEACWKWSLESLKWKPDWRVIQDATDVIQEENREDVTDQWLPKNYLSGDAPVYPQVFGERHGFQPNLSVLDLIFCTGPSARDFLAGS
ncbi:WbqC family protein [Parasegetibacter sp. NRK P23]|uniref:WbqC family protein n=1 Tax=Parasegetibacter sp. NRK P23 TaxID=2942999 RepID=UPI002042F293|nr:WbqC family protein [Parasegetibacter sp. NRK P23]MCM5528134.1 WbqC family protein [Parasegetibacter sp. NRK P23]